MVKIDLKGQIKEFEQGVTAADVAKSIGMGLYKSACAAKIDGQVCDLRTPIERDCSLEILTFDTAEGKHAYWHTTSHIMAQAVMRLYPGTKFSIGPAIENGFYYDFDLEQPLSTEDLPAIEEEMKKIIKENLPLERFELPPEEAEKLMADQPYKEELIAEHAGKGENISFYKQGDFTDLCAGPHLMSTGMVKAVKLTAITGAYWRGDAKNKMLTRVYGIAFPKQSMLEEHLQMLEEAKKRDHRRLGKELGLFMLRDEGPGFPFFLPKGMVLKNLLIDYWREVHKKYGYVEVSTPIILSRKLWERSGHWDHYKDNMYTTVIDEEDYAIKPMNCPGGMMVYQSQPHSYRDLPLRVGELGLVHRHELSGALHGLFRVRCFTQDDAHLFMTPDQLKDELKNVVRLFDEVYSVFGLSYKIELSTMPEDHIGTVEQWEHNQEILKEAITEMGKEYEVNEGDGASGSAARCSWTASCPSASSWSTWARTARSTAPSCCTVWCWAPSSGSSVSSPSTSRASSPCGSALCRRWCCPFPSTITSTPRVCRTCWRKPASGWSATCATKRLATRFGRPSCSARPT